MAFPNGTTQYQARIDKNASGWYIDSEYFNIPGSSPYEMYLDHVPRDSATTTVGASGGAAWTEVLVAPTAADQYYVDYDTGKVQFHSANADDAVEASYYNLGDDIMASHMNTVQEEIYNTQVELGDRPKGLSATVSDRLNAIQTDVNDKMPDASGINGNWITDDTVRAGALQDDIKGISWVIQGRPTLASNSEDFNNHLADPTDAHDAVAISAIEPGSCTFTNVQGHINASGGVSQTDANPHGLSLSNIGAGDIVVPGTIYGMEYVKGGDIYGEYIVASGTHMFINYDGADADSYLCFYENSDKSGVYLRWNDTGDKFELNDEILVHGDVTASGNFMPEASGSRYVGTQAKAFQEVNSQTGRFDTLYATDSHVSASTLYIGAQTLDERIESLSSDWSDPVDTNLTSDASGTRDMGTQATSFGTGNFDEIQSVSYKTGASTGANGSFVSGDGQTITVKNGIIVSIV